MAEPFIVKIQWPLAGEPKILIYNKRRTYRQLLAIDQCRGLKDIMGDQPKIFAKVRIAEGMMILEEVVPDQGW